MDSFSRSAGLLLPVSSLPSPYGIGSFGEAARRWLDFLAASKQRYWQVLPLGPTGYGNSPYQSFSAFAGNPCNIDPDELCREGLLLPEECLAVNWGADPARVDYGALFEHREPLLRKAFGRFTDKAALEAFRERNAWWLEDYALFMSMKSRQGMRSWLEWPDELRLRHPGALENQRRQLRDDVAYHVFVQYCFFRQWGELKRYAEARGIGIIGDVPIYAAMDSADVWANSGLFLLDDDRRPMEVAGCPPDAFSPDGQLWGNPLYRWETHRADDYSWWLRRLEWCFEMVDVVRIDHFRGFESYYAIAGNSATAAGGQWRKGPGMDFIGAVNRRFGNARIIAEDLGFLTDEVRTLLLESGYPGMKVLQFAFDSREGGEYMPHNYPRRCVVYTGTHDNDTSRGWLAEACPEDVALARDYLGISDGESGSMGFIRAALGSAADLAVIPMQDYLDLDREARMNTPATIGGSNWCWRMEPSAATDALAARMARLTEIFGRA